MKQFILYLKSVVLYPHRYIVAFFWCLIGKKLRGNNLLDDTINDVKSHYVKWQEKFEDFSLEQRHAALLEQKEWKFKPHFLIFIDQENAHSDTFGLDKQWYDNFKIIDTQLACDPNLGHHDTHKCPLYAVTLHAGDLLSENALFLVAKALQDASFDLITFDDDQLKKSGLRIKPYFKPSWNFLLQLSSNYIGHSCAYKYTKDENSEEFLAKIISARKEISTVHIPSVLLHLNPDSSHKKQREIANVLTWEQSLNKAAGSKKYTFDKGGWIEELLPSPKDKVSIIIPTRDMLTLLKKCVNSVLSKTSYSNFDIIIMDNDSKDMATLNYFKSLADQPKVKVISFPGEFNYSAINNFAVKASDAKYICLLNNDTEVISENWLSDLMKYAVQKKTGAVGAKLLYSDDKIQHAGVIIGLGNMAGHGHRFVRNKDAGYFHRPHQLQQVKAVTGACLVVQREKFIAVGGLDDKDLMVAFNDVDFCLKLDRAGYENVYVPSAVLYHYESKSRGTDLAGTKRERYLREVAIMQKRWRTNIEIDPNYSPNLNPDNEGFSIKFT